MRKLLLVVILAFLGAALLTGALLYRGAEHLFLRHERAHQLWTARRPAHYRYTLILQGELMHQTFGVEVDQGRLVTLTDEFTGISMTIPPTVSTNFLPTNEWLRRNLLIDDLFSQIKVATRLPGAADAFLVRANPQLYFRFAQQGWLPKNRPTCEPNFPEVEYNAVFGYPEKLYLAGEPCMNEEYTASVRLRIERFQALP
jgi:hypothetical protein